MNILAGGVMAMSARFFRVPAVFVLLSVFCPVAWAQRENSGGPETLLELLKPALRPEPVEAQELAVPSVSAPSVPVVTRTESVSPVAVVTRPVAPARPGIAPVPAGLKLVAPGAVGAAEGASAIRSGLVKPCRFPAMVGESPQAEALKATGRPWRVLAPGGAAGADGGFQPDRINLFTDGRGIVSRVECW